VGLVGGVPQSQGDAAEVLESSVDCFGWAVRGVGMIEIGQDGGAPVGQDLGARSTPPPRLRWPA